VATTRNTAHPRGRRHRPGRPRAQAHAAPSIGRKARRGKREPVIGRGSRGCVALHRHVPQQDLILVLALRRQREADYKRSDHNSP